MQSFLKEGQGVLAAGTLQSRQSRRRREKRPGSPTRSGASKLDKRATSVLDIPGMGGKRLEVEQRLRPARNPACTDAGGDPISGGSPCGQAGEAFRRLRGV